MNLQNQINYLRDYLQQDMFDDCFVPAGLDMQRVRGAIVMRCGLMTPLFSEPEVQRAATQQFFFENQWNFNHILNIIEAEYSPIENVQEFRQETTKNSGADTLTISRNSTETHSGTDARTIDTDGTTTDTNEISAENAGSYQADNRSTEEVDTTVMDNLTHGEIITQGGSDTHKQDKDSRTDFEVFRHGNVGITTNQDMINQELDLLERFNPYRFIANLYEKELMLGLY